MIPIKKLSEEGAADLINDICDGIRRHVLENPESAKELLEYIVDEVLDPLAEDDFWGTEGWAHAFGLEE